MVDSVTYSGTSLASIDLRFEQHCDGAGTAVRGKVHWTNGDTTQPAGPQVPPPAGLWQPAPGETPATGNYVYLAGDPGVRDLDGASILYTQADSNFRLNSFGAQFDISIFSYESWSGYFVGMNTLQRLQVGYYGNLQRAGSHNPTLGGIDFGGGRLQQGDWLVRDRQHYLHGRVDIRDRSALRAPLRRRSAGNSRQDHWAAGRPCPTAGPVNPVPAGLWPPRAGRDTGSGNYVYLQSDPGDYIGGGAELHATPQAD